MMKAEMEFCFQCGSDLYEGHYIPVRINGRRCGKMHRICKECGDNLLELNGLPVSVKKEDGTGETLRDAALACPACNSDCLRFDFVGPVEPVADANGVLRECPVCLGKKKGNFYVPVDEDGIKCHESHGVCEGCAISMYAASFLPGAPDISCGMCRREYAIMYADVDREYVGFAIKFDPVEVTIMNSAFWENYEF